MEKTVHENGRGERIFAYWHDEREPWFCRSALDAENGVNEGLDERLDDVARRLFLLAYDLNPEADETQAASFANEGMRLAITGLGFEEIEER